MNHATNICGVPECEEFAPSLDERFGQLCSLHSSRLRRAKNDGLVGDAAYAMLYRTKRALGNNREASPIAAFDLEKVKGRICDDGIALKTRPLLLFLGNLTEGRVSAMYNLLASAKDAEIDNFTSITKASELLVDPVHYCGLHKTVQRNSLIGFCSRLYSSPEVLRLETDWKDYLYWIAENSRAPLFTYDPITRFDRRARRPWRVLYRIPREPMTEHYPFITGKPTSDHELVLAVDSLVPKYLPPDTRADVCQDMIVSILTGEITLENLRDATKPYIKRVFKDAPSKYGHLSLDAPIDFGEGKSRTLGEMLV